MDKAAKNTSRIIEHFATWHTMKGQFQRFPVFRDMQPSVYSSNLYPLFKRNEDSSSLLCCRRRNATAVLEYFGSLVQPREGLGFEVITELNSKVLLNLKIKQIELL